MATVSVNQCPAPDQRYNSKRQHSDFGVCRAVGSLSIQEIQSAIGSCARSYFTSPKYLFLHQSLLL